MRSLGTVLMIIGLISGLLLLMARWGGGQIPATAFIVVALLTGLGWRFRTQGRPVPPADAALGSDPAWQAPSHALPYTTAMSAALGGELKRSRRILAILIASGMSFFVLAGVALSLAIPQASRFAVCVFLAGIGLVFALIAGAIWTLTREWPIRRDLRESTYLQTGGPVQLVAVYGGWLLRTADRAFHIDSHPAKVLQNMSWAVVDHSRHSHIIFEVRDRSGKRVYSGLD